MKKLSIIRKSYFILVIIYGEEIETTAEHPFYDEDGEQVEAQELQEGDKLTTEDGDTATVDSVECIHHDEPVTVYNFCVMEDHTYFIGEHGVLVHNECSLKAFEEDKLRQGVPSKADEVEWTNHGYKHFPDKKLPWRDIVKGTKNGPAKYSPEILDIEAFERDAWETGQMVTNGKNWKVKAYDRIIGATNGKETRYIRIEYSGNTIHGHPISLSEYNKLLR